VNDIVSSQSYYNYHQALAKRSKQHQQQQNMITPPTTPNRKVPAAASSCGALAATTTLSAGSLAYQQLRYVSPGVGLTPHQALHAVHLQDPSILHRAYIPTSYANVVTEKNNNLVLPGTSAYGAPHPYFGSPVSSIKSSPGGGGGLTRSPLGGSGIVERAWPQTETGRKSGGDKSRKAKVSPRNASPPQINDGNNNDQAASDILGMIGNGDAKRSNSLTGPNIRYVPPPPEPPESDRRLQGGGRAKGGSTSVGPLVDPRNSSGSCSSSNPNDEILNTSLCDSDHARSVSFSSDKFPPSPLVHARIHHGESMPFSPGSGFPIPPPSINDLSPRPAKSVKSITRLSSSEICDVPTPAPVQAVQFPRLRFNFNQRTLEAANVNGNDLNDVFL